MSFFQNVRSVWKTLRSTASKRPARRNRRFAPIEALEVRTLLAGGFSEELVPGGFVTRTQIDVSDLEASTNAVTDPGAELNGNGLQFNLIAAPGMSQQAIDGFQEAADLWSAVLRDDIIVNVNINFTPLGPQILGQTSAVFQTNSFTSVRTALASDAKSLSDATAVANLPAGSSLSMYRSNSIGNPLLDNNDTANNTTLNLTRANAKALGLTTAGNTASDGSVSFSTLFAFDFDRSDGIAANTIDFVGVAAHEIGHLLGFDSGASTVDYLTGLGTGPRPDLDNFAFVQPLDLFRFSAASETAGANIDLRADMDAKYFSIDGGTTQLTTYSTGSFNGDGQQASHWKDNLDIGLMDPSVSFAEFADLTNLDVQGFDVIGWDVGMDLGDAPDTAAGTATGNYATNLSDNGPRHQLFSASGNANDPTGVPKVYLGAGVTGELTALQNSTATGDSDNGVPSIPTLTTGTTQTFTVNSTGNNAILNYFVDFNRDGDFVDAEETFTTTLTSTSQTVSVVVPANASAGTTLARFRISTAGGLSSTGAANDGEVEDYQVTVATAPFTDLGDLGIASVRHSSVAWGDYDNDGDLDVLVTGKDTTGTYTSRVYRNDGNSVFVDIAAGLPGVAYGSAAWGDYDNDGDLDILLTGFTSASTRIGRIYRNNGDATFTNAIAGLAVAGYSSAAWGDMDNDGDLDLLVTGTLGSGVRASKIYLNSSGTFTEVANTGLPGIKQGSVAWGDADNDGDLDILLTGNDTSNNQIAKVFRNNLDGTFTDVNAGLPGVYRSSVAWGDYDNDGRLDILLMGKDSSNAYVSRVYHNDGNNVFSDSGAVLTGIAYGSASWGDVDNDGKLDMLLAGFNTSNTTVTKVYRNAGSNAFTDFNAGLIGSGYSAAAWGDVDGDGKLDILLTGVSTTNATPVTKVYRNNALTANTAPLTPTNLSFTFPTTTSLTLNWSAPADAQTPALGLSYNLRVGTTPGGSNVFSTMAHTTNGTRRLPDAGPIQGTSFTLKGLTAGVNYYWSVQAIDTAFAGSPFAAEQTSNSSNSAPIIGGAVANQTVNDNATKAVFSTLTITDPNTQPMTAIVRISNGIVRGDFTSATEWTRTTIGNDIQYSRFFNSTANIGATVQAAIRSLVFQPRSNAIRPNTTEVTGFVVTVTDGVASPVSNNTTSAITTSVNNAPTIGNPSNSVAVNDNATVNPFTNLTVADVDMQEMLISVTILNGVVRGDFTPASTTGWATRYTTGNDITYKRYFSPQANVGAAAQAAFRALVFQPRQNAITPSTTELTDFQVTVSDGVAPAVLGVPNTRVTTTSVNQAPVIGGAAANQTINDNQTRAVFSTLTVTDPDTQNILARVTISNGVNRGDFATASTAGWTRSVSGSDIVYNRFFSPVANIGATVQTAIRALIFQPRTNVPIGTTETTSFTVFINDGIANTTNSTTSVITTGVAPRSAASTVVAAPLFRDSDIKTVIVPTVSKPKSNPLARFLKRAR